MKKILSPNTIIIDICKKLHKRNLINAYGGNVSLRMTNKVIITPRGASLAELNEDDLVVIDFSGNVLFGTREPSSETMLHLKIYQNRQDIFGVVHTHPPAATAFAHVNRTIQPINPETRRFLEFVPIVPYHTVGSKELAEAVGEHIVSHDVLLLERHGLVTVGTDLYKAYNLAEMTEESALMNLYIKLLSI